MANIELRAVEMAQSIERSQRGNGSLFALFALARQQQRLAGRKAIVYFSEGLEVPNQLQPLYRSVVSEANRANLSVYSVDARGLLTTSGNDRTRTDLKKSGDNVRRQVHSRGGRAVTREDVLAGEVAENAITLNVQGMLGALSESTGGRLIANSNDVRTGLDHALADMAGYYEITYDPHLAVFDGTFRRTSVKVSRPGIVVQSREGYFALPPGEGSVDFPWELPLLKALKSSPPRTTSRPTRAPIASAPRGARCATPSWPRSPSRRSRSRAGAGRARPTSPCSRWCATPREPSASTSARTPPSRCPRRTWTPCGAATPSSRGASPSPRPLLARARRARRRHEAGLGAQERSRRRAPARGADPLEPRGGQANGAGARGRPGIGGPAAQRRDPHRSLRGGAHVPGRRDRVALPGGLPGAGDAPARTSLALEFSRDGEAVGRSSPELPAPDAAGRIPYVASVPTQSLKPGRYEVAAPCARATRRRGRGRS